MTTKFIYTRTYTYHAENGRRKHFFFHLVDRYRDKITFRLTDKGNTEVIETNLQIDENIECAHFVCKGAEIDLRADQYNPKGYEIPRLPDGSYMSEQQFIEWRKTSDDVLKNAHLYSSHHREEMLASTECGCFYCQRIFPTAEIEDWIDQGQTAICPYCGTDAVIPNVKGIVKVTPELLKALNEKYF